MLAQRGERLPYKVVSAENQSGVIVNGDMAMTGEFSRNLEKRFWGGFSNSESHQKGDIHWTFVG